MAVADNNANSAYKGNIYAAWTDFSMGSGRAVFSKSTDGGTHWSGSLKVLDNVTSYRNQGTSLAVGPTGIIYVGWANYSCDNCAASEMGFVKSTDGGNTFITYNGTVAFTYNGIRYTNGGAPEFGGIRINDFPCIDVDRSNGNYRGYIYAVVAENTGTDTVNSDIKFARSTNGGTTWQTGFTNGTGYVNFIRGKEQFFPWMSVDDVTGRISVTYYSQDTTGYAVNTYVAISDDGGATFQEYKVSNVSHTPEKITPDPYDYAGDYINVSSYGSKVYPFWMDNRSGGLNYKAYFSYSIYSVDQHHNNNSTFGTVNKWDGSNFSTVGPLPATLNDPNFTNEALQGEQDINSNEKYNAWYLNSGKVADVTNHHVFSLPPRTPAFVSQYNPTYSGVTIKNSLEGTTATGGNIQFKDPWFIDYSDPDYGNTLRNRSMSSPLISRSSPFYPNYNSSYGGITYKGVFLNQNIADSIYYSVQVPLTQTINGFTSYFQNWSATGASIQQGDPNPPGYDQKAVVFSSSSATVSAIYKGVQLSNNANAFSNNSQRKFVRTPDGTLHKVYESMGHVWYETSTNGGTSWSIMNSGHPLDNGAGKLPSIDYYGNVVAIAFQQQSGSNYTIQLKTFYSYNGSYVPGASTTIFTEPADGYSTAANPNISWGYNSKFMVTWERKNNIPLTLPYGINYKYGSLNNYYIIMYGSGSIYGTDASSVNASVYSNKSDYADGFQIAYEQDSWTKYIYYCRVNISSTWTVTTSSVTNISSGDGYLVNYQPSIIGMSDGSARVCWLGDYSGNGSTINTIYRNPSNGTFYSFGYNVRSTSINEGDNGSVCVGWSTNYGGSAWSNSFVDVSNPYSTKTLNTSGKDIQLSNGASKSNMYASSFYPFTSPYYFGTSSNLGSFGKVDANSISNGKGIVLVKGNVQLAYSLGDIVLGNNKIKMADSLNDKSISDERFILESEPFTAKGNSGLTFSILLGLVDSSEAVSLLGKDGFVNYKLELINDNDGTVLGKLGDEKIGSNNLSSNQLSSFKLNTNSLEGKTIKVRLTVKTNLDNPGIFYVGRYSSDVSALGKSNGEAKEITLQGNEIVANYALAQNYPNPFNPTTTINYQIPKDGFVTLKIYDVLGKEVATLVNENKATGRYNIEFNAGNLASGVYLYQIKVNDFVSTKKLVLLK